MLQPRTTPYLLASVCVISDKDKVFDTWRLNLLILGGKEHTRDTDKLQLAALHSHVGQKPVNVRSAQLVRLALEAKLISHLRQPVEEDGAHVVVDVALQRHVMCHGPRLALQAVTERGGGRGRRRGMEENWAKAAGNARDSTV